MKLNLWTKGGLASSYPNIYAVSPGLLVNRGSYIVTFTASSPSGTAAKLNCYVAGVSDFYVTDLSSTPKTYTTTKTVMVPSTILLLDINRTSDISVSNISVIQAPLPKLSPTGTTARSTTVSGVTAETAYTTDSVASVNRVSLNGNFHTKQNTHAIKANYVGKVAGNTDLVPHKGYRYGGATVSSTPPLITPANGLEIAQSFYDTMNVKDNSGSANTRNENWCQAQALFSFDLIRMMTDKYGTGFFADTDGTVAGNVAKLKNIITRIQADWWGYGSTILANPVQTTDYTGKVAGSTTENPNIIKSTNGISSTGPLAPSVFVTEATAANYTSVITNSDGNLFQTTDVNNGAEAQQLFSFNLIEYVKRKYNFTPDVAWLKANVMSTSMKWYGYGSGPGGNKAHLVRYVPGSNAYSSYDIANIYNTASSPTLTTAGMSNADINSCVDANGFVHYLAYAEPSDGVTASTVFTDYVSLDVTLAAGSNKATLVSWYPNSSTWSTVPRVSTSSSPTNLSYAETNMAYAIDSNGFCHYLAYTDASIGVNQSTIYTDYIELTVTVSFAEAGYDAWVNTDTTRQLPILPSNMLNVADSLPNDTNNFPAYGTGVTKVIDTTTGIVGISSIKVTTDGSVVNQGIYSSTSYYPIVANTVYSASAYVKGTSGQSLLIAIQEYDSSGNYLTNSLKTYTMTGNWQQLTVARTGSMAGVYARVFVITSGNTATTFWVDGFKLEAGATANAYSNGRNRNSALNFVGKVMGSTVANPHKAYTVLASTFSAPTTTGSSVYPWETSAQSNYDAVMQPDGTTKSTGYSTAGAYSQNIFEFDLSHFGMSLTDLKNALRTLSFSWTGYGNGDNAGVLTYGIQVQIWDSVNSQWALWQTTSDSAATAHIISGTSSTANWMNKYGGDANQKIYILVTSRYPASATNPSNIYLDYVALNVTLADYVDYAHSNIVKVKQSDITKVKLQMPRANDQVGIEYNANTNNVYHGRNLLPYPTDTTMFTRLSSETFTVSGGVLEINAPAGSGYGVEFTNAFKVLPNTNYTLSFNMNVKSGGTNTNKGMRIQFLNTNSFTSVYGSAFTFNTGNNDSIKVLAYGGMPCSDATVIDFSNMQLELGVAATTYTQYTNHVSKPQQRLVPEKNLLSVTDYSVNGPSTTYYQIVPNVPIVQGGIYTLSGYWTVYADDGLTNPRGTIRFLYTDGSFTDALMPYQTKDGNEYFYSVTATANIAKTLKNVAVWIFDYSAGASPMHRLARQVQLEVGGVATPFEPFKQMAPRKNVGLSFNGFTDYLTFPVINFDTIVLDMKLDQSNMGNPQNIFDTRFGTGTAYIYAQNGSGRNGISQILQDGNDITTSDIKAGYRTTVTIKLPSATATAYGLFSNYVGTYRTKGILYGVTCYLNGTVVSSYDFTNPKNIVGNTVMQNAQNLIPSFEYAGWMFNPGFQTLGKDTLNLNVTGGLYDATCVINVTPGQMYRGFINTNNNNGWRIYDGSSMTGTILAYVPVGIGGYSFTPTQSQILIRLSNWNAIGNFYYIRPQLYQLDGTEGTINGTPKQLNKPLARSLYAKR